MKKQHRKKLSLEIIISIISTIISTILVLFTLFEMRADRNAAYRPSVLLSNTEIVFAWDDAGKPLNQVEAESFLKYFSAEIVNASPQLPIQNIGVGTAKDVTFKWSHEKNISHFQKMFQEHDIGTVEYSGQSLFIIETANRTMQYGCPIETVFDYIANTDSQHVKILFPQIYYECLFEVYRHPNLNDDNICFELEVQYSDIQGKEYSETIYITPESHLRVSMQDGKGYAFCNLSMSTENTSMSTFFPDSDTLSAIASIFAVLVSIISLVFSIIFSRLQVKHNVNSVRPISLIDICDYEDLLAVKIINAGTGPLLITKMIAENDDRQSPVLIDLLPIIQQPWSTFMENIDGRTIPVGDEVILVELEPYNDRTKKAVRQALSKITITLEYTDIYKNKFSDKRKLDFFGRHS